MPNFRYKHKRLFISLTLTSLALIFFPGACLNAATSQTHDRSVAIEIPDNPIIERAQRKLVASNLPNPRGMLMDNNTLLVALAGEGLGDDTGSGMLVRLSDTNSDNVLDERQILLDKQPSMNILHLVRRDEVFGLADIARGGGDTLISAAFFEGPSQIYRLQNNAISHWNSVEGNINALAYDEGGDRWFAVSSSSEQVLELFSDKPAQELLLIPDLPEGQDPVPGYVRYEPGTGKLLVSLFSGSPLGEENGDGTEIVPGAGGIIRVEPDDGSFEWVVSGLTAPTDIAIDDTGRIFVLEFSRSFLDPVSSRDEMWAEPSHGGFERFSGRLLRIDPRDDSVVVIAEDLDGPTNLHVSGDSLFVAQGMGTPGRLIPGPQGDIPLTGFIEELILE